MESRKLREVLSSNIKKERKKLGLTQEKLAEIAGLSAQTVNDIEGCRMWVSDKTITRLARVLNVEVYELLVPPTPAEYPKIEDSSSLKLLFDLEDKVIRTIRHQFRETINLSHSSSP